MGWGGGSRRTTVRGMQHPRPMPAAAIGPGVGGAVALATAGAPVRARRPERNAVTPGDDDRRRVERSYLRFAAVGVQFAASIFLLTILGIWLDGRFHTAPLFTIVGLLIGFVGATWTLVHTVLGPDQGPDRPTDKPDQKA